MGTTRTVIVHVSLDPWGQPVVVATDDTRTNGLTCLVGTVIAFRCQALQGRPLSNVLFESQLLEMRTRFMACLFLSYTSAFCKWV